MSISMIFLVTALLDDGSKEFSGRVCLENSVIQHVENVDTEMGKFLAKILKRTNPRDFVTVPDAPPPEHPYGSASRRIDAGSPEYPDGLIERLRIFHFEVEKIESDKSCEELMSLKSEIVTIKIEDK